MPVKVVAYLFLLTTLFGCSDGVKQIIVNQYSSDSDSINVEQDKTIVFKNISFKDTIITNEDFLSVFIPESYLVNQSIFWNSADVSDPLKFQIEIKDSFDSNTITFFPSLTFITKTASLPLDLSTVKLTKDTIYESSHLPTNAIDALTDYVIPLYITSPEQVRNVEKKPLSNIHFIRTDNKEDNGETACVKFEYTNGEKQYEQIIYGTLEKHFTQIESYNSTCEWRIKNIVSIRTAKGYLDDNIALFQTVINSSRISPLWAYHYAFLCKNNLREKKHVTLSDYQNIFKHTPPLSEATELADYHRLQNILRKTFLAYSMYKTQIEYYIDKDGINIALPKGYIAAWSSTASEILLTEVPNFKPIQSGDVAWVQIKRNESQSAFYFLDGSSAPDSGDPLVENDLFR